MQIYLICSVLILLVIYVGINLVIHDCRDRYLWAARLYAQMYDYGVYLYYINCLECIDDDVEPKINYNGFKSDRKVYTDKYSNQSSDFYYDVLFEDVCDYYKQKKGFIDLSKTRKL